MKIAWCAGGYQVRRIVSPAAAALCLAVHVVDVPTPQRRIEATDARDLELTPVAVALQHSGPDPAPSPARSTPPPLTHDLDPFRSVQIFRRNRKIR
jgi:hypothetical protein